MNIRNVAGFVVIWTLIVDCLTLKDKLKKTTDDMYRKACKAMAEGDGPEPAPAPKKVPTTTIAIPLRTSRGLFGSV
eukprot:SAG31_NODE_4380_length_3288_cov_3.080903_3_plen_76_part_00